jgi:hypothetical protein
MATPDPEVDEILMTLAESPLQWIASAGRAAIAALPEQRRQTPRQRLEAAHEQLDVMSRAVLAPLKRELEALDRLPELAQKLEISPSVKLVFEADEGRSRVVDLTGVKRRQALDTFTQVLGKAIGDARERVIRREGPSVR